MQPEAERHRPDQNRGEPWRSIIGTIEDDAVDAPEPPTIAIDNLLIQKVSADVHYPPPRICSGITTIAISAHPIVSRASRPLPIGPLVCTFT